MNYRILMLGLAGTGWLAATSLPASAQVVDDFMCSTFSYKCNQQKPLPPPQLAPGTEPIDAPAKTHHVASHKHKAVKRTAAAPESAPTSPPSPADSAK